MGEKSKKKIIIISGAVITFLAASIFAIISYINGSRLIEPRLAGSIAIHPDLEKNRPGGSKKEDRESAGLQGQSKARY